MTKTTQPLAEVFGHDPRDFSERAVRYRRRRLCPFNNKVPSCTKDKAADPLGVCSVNYAGVPVATCPPRDSRSKNNRQTLADKNRSPIQLKVIASHRTNNGTKVIHNAPKFQPHLGRKRATAIPIDKPGATNAKA